MGATVGQLLPLALGIAISPLPIIAGILMLMSPRARSTSVGFLLGWLAGIALVITVFSLLSSVRPGAAGDGAKPVLAVVRIALGLLLLLLAFLQWRGRPREGAQPTVPKWMQQIDGMSFTSALGLGLLLSGANPKNLLLGASAGVTVGAGALGGAATTARNEHGRAREHSEGHDQRSSGSSSPPPRCALPWTSCYSCSGSS